MSQTLTRPLASRIAALVDAPAPPDVKSTPSSARDAAIEALETDKTHYTTRPGIVPLREWVSAHVQAQFGYEAPVDAITITCGMQEAEFVALKTLTVPGNTILYSGDDTVRANLSRYIPLLDVTLTDTPNEQVSVLYVSAKVDSSLLEQAVENEWWIIWSTVAAGASIGIADIEGAVNRTVLIGEMEDQLPGWRIGWMVGSEQANNLRAYKQSMTICSPSISQWAAYGLVSADND